MKPEERAEKILMLCQIVYGDDMRAKVVDQIREAVDEEAMKRADWNYRIECLEKQLKEAYEDAARIAAANLLSESQIPNKIRARAKEITGK